MRLKKRHLFRRPSDCVKDMENELLMVREIVGNIKKCKNLNNVPDDVKQELHVLFKATSGQYSFEE